MCAPSKSLKLCVFVWGGGGAVCFFHQLGRLALSLSPDTCCRSSGCVPSRSQDCSRQDLILQGSRDTMCACVSVSLPGLYQDIIIKGDICVTQFAFCLFICFGIFFLFFTQVSSCLLFQHNGPNLTPRLMSEPLKRSADG